MEMNQFRKQHTFTPAVMLHANGASERQVLIASIASHHISSRSPDTYAFTLEVTTSDNENEDGIPQDDCFRNAKCLVVGTNFNNRTGERQ